MKKLLAYALATVLSSVCFAGTMSACIPGDQVVDHPEFAAYRLIWDENTVNDDSQNIVDFPPEHCTPGEPCSFQVDGLPDCTTVHMGLKLLKTDGELTEWAGSEETGNSIIQGWATPTEPVAVWEVPVGFTHIEGANFHPDTQVFINTLPVTTIVTSCNRIEIVPPVRGHTVEIFVPDLVRNCTPTGVSEQFNLSRTYVRQIFRIRWFERRPWFQAEQGSGE